MTTFNAPRRVSIPIRRTNIEPIIAKTRTFNPIIWNTPEIKNTIKIPAMIKIAKPGIPNTYPNASALVNIPGKLLTIPIP